MHLSKRRETLTAQGYQRQVAILERRLDRLLARRVAALRFTDPRVHASLNALVAFRFLPHGFANHDLRALLAPLLGLAPGQFTPQQMTYHHASVAAAWLD